MENVIQQIIDIDRRAQQKQIAAEQYSQKAQQAVREEIQKMDDRMQRSSKEKLDALIQSQTELLKEKRSQLAVKLDSQKQLLEKIYQENHLKWEQELFQKVLEG